ncbi:hypothetical protein [Syntrophorhabdus aromaticivorans]|uniref:hypothetical protein n=1 Tax=Syntrophorhabdus aromaticivorans TaxID=328301 RepID=UPI00048CFFFB|nr:hypothetical protein [Syntrophorhabdus aromaticivorans]
MAELLNYSKLTKTQQGVYNDIVSFGKSHGFSRDQINRVLLLGFVESKFNAGATNSKTIRGVFQYGRSRWTDYCSDDQYSTVGLSIWQTLIGWGYVGDNKPSTFNQGATDKQIAVTFAALKVLEAEFMSGTRHSEFVSQYWTAYDNATAALGDKAPTTQTEKMMLFFEAGHHGPNNISEVVTGWKNKVQPNIDQNLLFLRSLKTSSLFDDCDLIDLTPKKIANSIISEASTQIADVDDDSPATLQAIQNAVDRESIISTLLEIMSDESENQIVGVQVTQNQSVTITFSNGNSYTIDRSTPADYTLARVTVPSGPPTNLFSLTTNTSFSVTQLKPEDLNERMEQVNQNILISDGVATARINEICVNEATGNEQMACYQIADGLMPANNNPADTNSYSHNLSDYGFNTATQNSYHVIPVDPLVLDLNGDGVKLTDFSSNPVLFDADHDGAREQTGWVSPEDGILVKDLNANGIIDNISETLSEYFGGTAGTGGSPGTKPYHDGFAALKSLDSNHDNVFNSSDTAWNSVKVWVDANHDGKSWRDTDGDGIKDAGEATELKALTELGITSINLSPTTQSGLVRDGNEILASGTFTLNGQTKEALAANF